MSSLTRKEVKVLMNRYESSPGFVLNLSRKEFADIFDEIDVDIFAEFNQSGNSMGKCLGQFFTDGEDSDILIIRELLDSTMRG